MVMDEGYVCKDIAVEHVEFSMSTKDFFRQGFGIDSSGWL